MHSCVFACYDLCHSYMQELQDNPRLLCAGHKVDWLGDWLQDMHMVKRLDVPHRVKTP